VPRQLHAQRLNTPRGVPPPGSPSAPSQHERDTLQAALAAATAPPSPAQDGAEVAAAPSGDGTPGEAVASPLPAPVVVGSPTGGVTGGGAGSPSATEEMSWEAAAAYQPPPEETAVRERSTTRGLGRLSLAEQRCSCSAALT
jgi:hypothetical protein